ncbi:Retrovirus-related Pol polyprotein from transposon TNT 1-94 [Dendrobium catenatum]|uniref:Retrovirus-related Pol polyprotein from transposon TNT 1-94 n=1 Tax=Dendrobium catenatum TaxID=906689 RepID=A0A2I0X5H2_9ASPA|nr:Retrovirus-related Pol polyprotein from transposon TNT 1-94 [Dendrobium catenatum]
MAEEDSALSRRTTSHAVGKETEICIPPHLKFLISNIKNLVPTQLTSENYSIWRLQLFQHVSTNGYGDYLSRLATCPPEADADDHARWKLIDQNLVSAIFSTISASILPYVLTLNTARDVWLTLECRLQPTNRSRVIQLKNKLHQIQLKDRTMLQYMDQIKKIVDNTAAAGSNVDTEDIVLYILNGLPAMYNPFKTAIRTSLQLISLDDLYSLLCSEEINLHHQHNQELQQSDTAALFSGRNTSYRSKNSKSSGKFSFPR